MKMTLGLLSALVLAIGLAVGCGESVPDQGPQGEAAPLEGVEHAEMGGEAAAPEAGSEEASE